MVLFTYLSFCVIFSALVMAMAGQTGSRLDKISPAALIAIEVLALLVAKDVFDAPGLSDGEARRWSCIATAIIAFAEFIRRDEKAWPLLAFFGALTQLLYVLDIVSA